MFYTFRTSHIALLMQMYQKFRKGIFDLLKLQLCPRYCGSFTRSILCHWEYKSRFNFMDSSDFCYYLANNVKQDQAKSFKVIQCNSSIVNVSKIKPYKAINFTLLHLYRKLRILLSIFKIIKKLAPREIQT